MAVAARKIETQERQAHLRLARSNSTAKSKGRNRPRSRSNEAACRELYRTFAIGLVVLTVLGVGRVALSAKATEVSMRSTELRRDIKAARYRGDMLEVQQTALASPSRIRSMTATTMAMADATDVCYIDLRGNKVCPAPEQAADAKKADTKAADAKKAAPAQEGAGRLPKVVASVMEVAAGEARVLLVGDVGLDAPK